MLYREFVDLYEDISKVSGRLEKIRILGEFLRKLSDEKGRSEWLYLLKGKVVADYDSRELGISRQIAFKAISISFGVKEEDVIRRFNKIGDLGKIAEEFSVKKRQGTLFSGKLDVEKGFVNLRKVMEIEGKGAVEKKLAFVSELLSMADASEAKYIVRTLLQDLRIGMADGVIKEAIASAFFDDDGRDEMVLKIEEAYDLSNDYAEIFSAALNGRKGFDEIGLKPGRPINVMLAVKAENIEDAFRICGKPAAIEQKYDGFRVIISKDKKGRVELFTRRLENVTKQFPDVISAVEKNIKGDSFMLDAEIVGYDPKSKKYLPFQGISQRIKRKYDIDKVSKELPVELNVFDCVYYNGKSFLNKIFRERREIVEKIIKEEKLVIRPAVQIITDNAEEAMEFYQEALKIGEEGIMIKSLDAPYKQGRRTGYMCKLKPVVNDLDLVIVGAEYGSGKRAGWLTSYIVACLDEGEYKEIGKVSSGLKELEGEGKNTENSSSLSLKLSEKVSGAGTTYDEMTKMLKPLILGSEGNMVRVKPKIVVSVTYQDIQASPSYTSGYALRFPRISSYRPDRNAEEITRLWEVEKEVKTQRIKRG